MVAVAVDDDTVKLSEFTTACVGPVERTPKPNATTTASAMRLKLVLFDICFLSLVVKKTFFFTAGKERFPAS